MKGSVAIGFEIQKSNIKNQNDNAKFKNLRQDKIKEAIFLITSFNLGFWYVILIFGL